MVGIGGRGYLFLLFFILRERRNEMYTINDLFQIGREIDPSILLNEANKKFQKKNIEEKEIGKFKNYIKNSKKILLIKHRRMDRDAYGS